MNIHDGQWLPLTALALGAAVRLLKSDTKLPIDVPPEHRMKLAWVLGLVIGVVDLVAGGEPVGAAILAVGSPLLAHVGHEVFIEAMRGGREIKLPGLMKPTDKDRPAVLPPIAIVLLALLSVSCTASFDEAKLAGAHDRKLGAAPGSPDRCASLSDARDTWSIVGKFGAGVGTAGALAPLHETARDDPTGRYVSIGVASAGALVAGVGLYAADVKGASWARECSQ